jgi:hypothetical protein
MGYVAGFLAPQLIGIAPASTHEFVYPLNQLVYMAKEGTVAADGLLQQGYTITTTLKVEQKQLDEGLMGGIPQARAGRLWTGLATCKLTANKDIR